MLFHRQYRVWDFFAPITFTENEGRGDLHVQ
jgi:hypothetical protein